MSEIRTPRLTLRRARIEDLEAVHALLSDRLATRYWAFPAHEDLAQSRDWLQSMIDAPPDQSDDYLIEFAGRVIGKAGCWRLPEIGIILHPDHWGRGLAHEAMEAVIPRVFARFPVAALIADIDPRNAASLRLFERLGFVETGSAKGTYEVGGEVCDSIYLALARPGVAADHGTPPA